MSAATDSKAILLNWNLRILYRFSISDDQTDLPTFKSSAERLRDHCSDGRIDG